ncbi:MAG: translocation/assembly module TamB domain-containing protein [Kofleriaceae bacterium]
MGDTAAVEGKRKRSLSRRILRIVGRLVAVVVVLVVVLVIFLHTPWGKSFVRGRIEAKLGAAVNGTVTIGSLDYGFLFKTIELGNVEIRDASGKPAIAVGSIAVELDRGSLLDKKPLIPELAITGLAVTVVQNADGTSNLTGLFKPSDRKPLAQLRITKLAVAGTATITKPDGTVIEVRDLAVAGNVDARPAAKELDLVLANLGAKVTVTRPGQPVRTLDVALTALTIARRPDRIDAEIKQIAAGVLGIEGITAHVGLGPDGKPIGAQAVNLGTIKVDSKQLAVLLGKQVLVDDLAIAATASGPLDKLVLHGAVKTRDTTLALDGTIDASHFERPTYQLALVGKGKSIDVVVPRPDRKLPAVETDLKIGVTGAGLVLADLEAEVTLDVGATMVNAIAIDSVSAKAKLNRGAVVLERFAARGLGFEIGATGDLAADKTLRARVTVVGSPAEAIKVLGAAGIAIPRKVPVLHKLDVAVNARGKLDGELVVEIEPTRIAIAGGGIGIAGTATLDNRKLRSANTTINLAGLDIHQLAALAGKPPPKVKGSISGTIGLVRTPDSQNATYSLGIKLREPGLTIAATGSANATSAFTKARILRSSDRVELATVDARLPLDAQGFAPSGRWHVALHYPSRSLGELRELLPERLREKLPEGEFELHANLLGSPARPLGVIDIHATAAAVKQIPGPQVVDLHAVLGPGPKGLAVKVDGTVALDAARPIAKIDAKIDLPALWNGRKLDIARVRPGLVVDATIDLPDRELASLADVRAKLAELGGSVNGKITVRGAPANLAVDAKLDWHGYGIAGGGDGDTTIAIAGSPKLLTATIVHNKAITIVADVDRTNPDRIAIKTTMTAPETPLLNVIPTFAAAKVTVPAGAELGTLRWDMQGAFALVRTPEGMKLDDATVTGALAIHDGAFALPHTDRKWHDIGLDVTSDAAGIHLKTRLHETDLQIKDRSLAVDGTLTLHELKPSKLALTLAAKDWLVFSNSPTLGMIDAPKATVDFDIGVDVDLASPVIGVDATIRQLELRSPDRLDRSHQVDVLSISGDIIYVDGKTQVGKLPVPPVVLEAPKKRRAIDARIHVPAPIHLVQVPFDVMAKGEMTVTVRDEGIVTRGALAIVSGKLNLFGRDHRLVKGSLSFTDEHPKGDLALTFERKLADYVMRELSHHNGGARVTFAGPPTKPKTALEGSANAALTEGMSIHSAGRPVNVTRPGLPASSGVTAPRGDQLSILTYMASHLPHLLFLDRMLAWSDPYEPRGSYGQIKNVEAERYAANAKSRVRAVARPNQPGRSTAELQWDRLFLNTDQAAVGVGLRGGDRAGGGVGLFFEWSSAD